MRIVLRRLENVTFYFDNIYVYGKTFKAHSGALEQVRGRLELHGPLDLQSVVLGLRLLIILDLL